METTGLEPENAENNALIDAPEVDSEGVEVEGAESAPAAAETGKPATRDKVQERFDTLTREKYEALSARDRERYQREALEARLAQLEASNAKPETVAPSNDYPTLESVGWDEAKHAAAVAEWVRNQTGESVKSELAREREAAQRAEAERAHERREAEFVKTKPDYSAKVMRDPRDGGPVISDAMADVIRQSDLGPDVAYYLAENVEKSIEIARLPPFLQARELGRIEARIEAAKSAPPPVSKAPPPASRVDGASTTEAVSTTDPDSDNLSDEDWFKAERNRLKRMRNRNG